MSRVERDELASQYLDQLPFEPYPVQEEALLAWFMSDEGVLVCAPTGMGKTLIAEAAAFEALHTRRTCYYTTPLIALTEQKLRELQASAVRWGFSPDDVGLVTGNRCVNPDAPVLVVVAEILLNRLLHTESFDFSNVGSAVMDEFHSFADPERGIVWELSLGLLPKHVRLLLLSATVGNAAEFVVWLERAHQRKLELVQSTERKVPLSFEWVPDKLLNEQLQAMAEGDDDARRTPALVFCFNRNECWDVAEQLKGRHLLTREAQKQLDRELGRFDWSEGAGPKLRQLMLRGVGVHHAGILPKYRRVVEEFFQRKLLQVCICTETLAAGINLPARSVVLSTLLKGPAGKKKLIAPSSAHQIFGRAGRPQYDRRGFVYAIVHEDDVKILRWREKYDQIPEDTKDPNLRRMKKRLKKKMPTRRSNQQYWNEVQFRKLCAAPPGKLASRGPLPWRLLAYLIRLSPEVDRLKTFVQKRLTDSKHLQHAEEDLIRMLMTLSAAGYVTLDPEPPKRPKPSWEQDEGLEARDTAATGGRASEPDSMTAAETGSEAAEPTGGLGALLREANVFGSDGPEPTDQSANGAARDDSTAPCQYEPHLAHPTPALDRLLIFRSVNPVYGDFLIQQLGIADRDERIQALESVLEIPGSLARQTRPPKQEDLPPGPLTRERLDPELLRRGLALPAELAPQPDQQDTWDRWDRPRILTVAEKLHRLFQSELPGVHSLRIRPAWVAGEVLRFNGKFNTYVKTRDLVKQEGIVFRHLLRFILLCNEFQQLCPPETDDAEWRDDLCDICDQVTACCRQVDRDSTDKILESAQAAPDVVLGETKAEAVARAAADEVVDTEAEFAAGVWDDE